MFINIKILLLELLNILNTSNLLSKHIFEENTQNL